MRPKIDLGQCGLGWTGNALILIWVHIVLCGRRAKEGTRFECGVQYCYYSGLSILDRDSTDLTARAWENT